MITECTRRRGATCLVAVTRISGLTCASAPEVCQGASGFFCAADLTANDGGIFAGLIDYTAVFCVTILTDPALIELKNTK